MEHTCKHFSSVRAKKKSQSGVNGLLDVARQTYHEANTDAYQQVTELGRMIFKLQFI